MDGEKRLDKCEILGSKLSRSGLPLQIEARSEPVTQPTLTYVKKTTISCAYLTRGELTGIGEHAHLTENGIRLMQLLIWPE